MSARKVHPEYSAVMSLGQHLDELRRRLIFGLLGLAIPFLLALYFGKQILTLLMVPAEKGMLAAQHAAEFQALGPLETFSAYLKVSFVATLIVGLPWLLYQLWLFIAPGLYDREKRFVYILVPLSSVLAAAGAVFVYFIVVPAMMDFFITFSQGIGTPDPTPLAPPEGTVFGHVPILPADPIDAKVGDVWALKDRMQLRLCVGMDGEKPVIYSMALSLAGGIAQHYRLSEYIGLLTTLTLAFAGAFQMPVVVLLLGWSGLVQVPVFTKFRRHAALACTCLAAILSPGDPTSMFAMMVPLYLLYELGILILRLAPAHRVAGGFTRGQRAKEARQQAEERLLEEPEPVASRREPADAGDP